MKKIFILFLFVSAVVLSADENFKWLLKDGKIFLHVAEKCYLYADTVQIEAYTENGKKVDIPLPPTVDYEDEMSGAATIIPSGSYTMEIPQNAVKTAKISYQGCRKADENSDGICFMPQNIKLGDDLPEQIDSRSGNSIISDFRLVKKHEGTMNKDQMLAFLNIDSEITENVSWWEGKSAFFVLFLLLSGGFLLNFTPCILPMIPINLAIIGAGGEKTPFAGFMRGVYYAIGMTCAYGALGLAAILSGARFGELNSSMYFNFAVAVIFFALALAMAGVWNLDFSAKQNSINPMKWKIARPIAIFLMGATAALLGGACVAPAVVGMILLAVSFYKEIPVLGVMIPFVFGFGMGILWILAGATMGKVLPKPGKWMVYVKNILALIIGILGIYYAWVGFSLIPGKFDAASECSKFYTALEKGGDENKLIFVDFWASWCKNCSAMEKTVLSDDEVREKLQSFEVVKFQAEDLRNEEISKILKYYEIQGLPAFIILEKVK